MNLATEAERKLTKIIDVFTGVIIPPAVGQEDAILVDDSQEEVVSDLSSCELKHANTERSRTPSEPRIPPGQQPVYFGADLSAAELQNRLNASTSELLGYFEYNRTHENDRSHVYQDFPARHVWKQQEKRWAPRRYLYTMASGILFVFIRHYLSKDRRLA